MVLDGIGNPHNMGAILRSMAHFGLSHVISSEFSSESLPASATRVAEGGAENVAIHRPGNLIAELKRLQKSGYVLVGTAALHPRAVAMGRFQWPEK